jgi:GTP cyclohydrolase I
MRNDFSKQLVKRERLQSPHHCINYRYRKLPSGAVDDKVSGLENIQKPFNYRCNRKSFNENLTPQLATFLQRQEVGQVLSL